MCKERMPAQCDVHKRPLYEIQRKLYGSDQLTQPRTRELHSSWVLKTGQESPGRLPPGGRSSL